MGASASRSNNQGEGYRLLCDHVREKHRRALETDPGFQAYDAVVVGGGDDEAKGEVRRIMEAVSAYETSVAFAAKEKLVRTIAQALKDLQMGIVDPGMDVAAAKYEDVARAVREWLKKKQESGKPLAFRAGDEDVRKFCQTIAKVLNDHFTPGVAEKKNRFIDTTLGPAQTCRQVVNWMHSFIAGINTEFMSVVAQVRSEFVRLNAAHKMVTAALAEVNNIVDKIPELQFNESREILQAALNEMNRAIKSIGETMKDQVPLVEADMTKILSAQQEYLDKLFNGLSIDKLEKQKELGLTLTYLVSTAVAADQVHKALTILGKSVGDYMQVTDPVKFAGELDKVILAAAEAKVPGVKLDLLTLAKQELLKYLDFRKVDEFQARLDSRTKAYEEGSRLVEGADITGGADATGGADVTGGAAGSYDYTLSETLKLKEQAHEARLRNFAVGLEQKYDQLLRAIEKFTRLVANNHVHMSESLDEFRSALMAMNSLSAAGSTVSLENVFSDLDVTAEARTIKDNYLSALKSMRAALDEIAAENSAGEVKSCVSEVKNVIAEIESSINLNVALSVRGAGAERPVLGGAGAISRTATTLARILNFFNTGYYLASVRQNFERAGKEVASYAEKYDNILGVAVANKTASYTAAAEALKKAPVAGLPPAAAAARDALIEEQFATKKRFYRQLEAVDLFLKNFTVSITANPESVKKAVAALNGIQVISNWYDNLSGNSLAFAHYMDMVANDVPITAADREKHFYEFVETRRDKDWLARPDDRQIVVATGVGTDTKYARNPKIDAIRKQIKTALGHFQALKNLFNLFVRFGSSGGSEMSSYNLNPTTVYEEIEGFLVASSVEYDFGTGQFTISKIDGEYKEEYLLFGAEIKAIAAKVFTVMGIYSLFNTVKTPAFVTETRVIIGAGPVEVIPEAADLYFRLPRLIEFYRDLFELDVKQDLQISMLPDMDSLYGKLLVTLFVKKSKDSVENGDYTEGEMNMIISECNKIYKNFASKENACREALVGLVSEINRRYGVIQKKDAESYYKLRAKILGRSAEDEDNRTSYSILPGEDQAALMGSKTTLPSDRFLDPGMRSAVSLEDRKKYLIEARFKKLLTDFRDKLLAHMSTIPAPSSSDFTTRVASYYWLIKQAQREMGAAEGGARQAVAYRLIRSSRELGADLAKLSALHETVVSGLALLSYWAAFMATLMEKAQAAQTLYDKRLGDDDVGNLTAERYALLGDAAGANSVIRKLGITLPMPADTIRMLYTLKATKMFDVTINRDGVIIGYSDFKSKCEKFFVLVKTMFNAFRSQLPANIIKAIEGTVDQFGTIAFVEKKLMDDVFLDKKVELLEGDSDAGIDKFVRNVSSQYRAMTATSVKVKYGNAMYTITKNDTGFLVAQDGGATTQVTGHAGTQIVDLNMTFLTLLTAQLGVGLRPNAAFGPLSNLLTFGPSAMGARGAAAGINPINEFTEIRLMLQQETGIIPQFNFLLYCYLNAFVDKGGNFQIYNNLVNPIANGFFSNAVLETSTITAATVAGAAPTYSFNDFSNNKWNNARRKILYLSLAQVLYRLVKDNDRNGKPLSLVMSMTDIPAYMKENYATLLPYFEKHFYELYMYTSVVKQVVNKVGGLEGLDGFYADVAQACMSMSDLCKSVLKELVVKMTFCEVADSSIEQYKQRNGRLPAMPLSLVFGDFYTKQGTAAPSLGSSFIFPGGLVSGTNAFKLVRGKRAVYCAPYERDAFPSTNDIIDDYNKVSKTGARLETDVVASFVSQFVEFVKSYVGSSQVGSQLAAWTLASEISSKVQAATAPRNPLCYFVQPRTEDHVYSLVTAEDPLETFKTVNTSLTAMLSLGKFGEDRKYERMNSIIDMNIVPVNVHALMKGIPLAPTYNYEATLDHMVASMFGVKRDPGLASVAPETTNLEYYKKSFVEFLLRPFEDQRLGTAGSAVRTTFRRLIDVLVNSRALNMGRPKYLADQVWGKLLSQSEVPFIDRTRGTADYKQGALPDFETYWYNNALAFVADGKSHSIDAGLNRSLDEGAQTGLLDAVLLRNFNTCITRTVVLVVNLSRVLRKRMAQEFVNTTAVLSDADQSTRSAHVLELGEQTNDPNEVLSSLAPDLYEH